MTEVATRSTPSWLRFAHRTPIDGLRAIAALLVVLFHAEAPGFDNGYVGVDVFFVLSGYLITSLLLREHAEYGRISLVGFYARRSRRLFPAAITVLVVTAIAYVIVASPLDVLENREGFFYAAIYVSNWYFLARSQDYFAQDASPSPVLHYWSLSVEEQFYLIWPLALLALLLIPAVRTRLAPVVLGALAVGGLAFSGLIARQDPMLSYFGTFSRAYQLLLGATLAAAILWWDRQRDGRPPGRSAHAAGMAILPLGLAVLIVASTNVGPTNPWLTGIIGCFATVAVLAGIEMAPSGPIQGALSTRVSRALGRWSYSIYLWHWPVIVLAAIVGILPALWWWRVPAVLGVTIALAAFTWWAIESRAMRVSLSSFARKRAAIVGGVALTLTGAIAVLLILRVPPQVIDLYERVGAVGAAEDMAVVEDADPSEVAVPETSSSAPGEPSVALVGDSHAFMWWPGLRQYAVDEGFSATRVTKSACPWMRVLVLSEENGEPMDCDGLVRDPAVAAVKDVKPDVLILASRSVLVREFVKDGTVIRAGEPGWLDYVREGAQEFIAEVSPYAKRIVLIDPIPETADSMLKCLAEGVDPVACDQPGMTTPDMRAIEALYDELEAENPSVVSVSLDELTCPGGTCRAMVDGVPTRRDVHHLNYDFAASLMRQFAEVMREAGVPLTRAR